MIRATDEPPTRRAGDAAASPRPAPAGGLEGGLDAGLSEAAVPETVLSETARRARLVLEVVPGERRLLPGFGCRIHEIPSLSTSAERQLAAACVEDALERWAPDLGVERAEVLPVEEGLARDGAPASGSVRLRLRARGAWHALTIAHRHPRAAKEAEER